MMKVKLCCTNRACALGRSYVKQRYQRQQLIKDGYRKMKQLSCERNII